MVQCCACRKFSERLDRCHVKTRASGAGWEDFEFIMMCRSCHIKQGHLNWKRFLQLYPHLTDILKQKGWALTEEFGISKMRRIV